MHATTSTLQVAKKIGQCIHHSTHDFTHPAFSLRLKTPDSTTATQLLPTFCISRARRQYSQDSPQEIRCSSPGLNCVERVNDRHANDSANRPTGEFVPKQRHSFQSARSAGPSLSKEAFRLCVQESIALAVTRSASVRVRFKNKIEYDVM